MRAERHAALAWLALSIALVTALVWANMAILGDGFWTLATGRWILAHGALPVRDPFAYASTSGRWIVHMPLCEVAFAWIDAHAGLSAVMLTGAALELGAVLVLWLGSARTLAARAATLPVALWFVYLGAGDLSLRGQLFGDLGFSALLVCLFRIARGARVHPVVPLVLGAVWANTHPSFLLAVGLPVAYAVLSRLDDAGERAALRPLFVFAALVALGTLANPYGPLMHWDVLRLLANRTTARVDLFESPDFHSLLWLAAPASGLAFAWLRLARGRAPRRRSDAALLLGGVVATCWARRYGTLLAGVELAVAGNALSHEVPRRIAERLGARVLLAAAGLEALGALGLLATHVVYPLRDVPVAATACIRELSLSDNVMSPYHWGGYLEYAWDGRRKAFIDGRNQLFDNGAYDDALRLSYLMPGWRTVLDVYEARTVLWERGAPLDVALARSPRWQLVCRGRLADVYVRRRGRP
jgi:hypothetical protein